MHGPLLAQPPGTTPADGATFVGVVTGEVTTETEHHRFAGRRILVAALVAAGVMLVFRRIPGLGATGSGTLLGRSMPLLILLALGSLYAFLLANVVGGYVRHASGAEMPLAVRRFQAQSLTGEVRDCRLVGDLHGDEVRNGNVVRMHGRRDRHGVYRVHSLETLTGPGGAVIATATARPPAGFRTMSFVDVIGKVVGAVVLVWLATLVIGTVR